jgi:homoaconitate hydratase family protein
MIPQSMTHKILAKQAGLPFVQTGEHIIAQLSMAFSHDPVIGVLTERFYSAFGPDAKIWDPKRFALFQDHLVPAKNMESRNLIQIMDKFVADQKIEHYFQYGQNYGVCHIIMMEQGLALPGELICGTDSHTVTYGSFNSFAAGIGVFDLVSALKTGTLWFTVPEIIKVHVDGVLAANVQAKDLILKLVGDIKLDGASGKTIEWSGSTVENMSLDERATLCNMAVEAGATNGIMPLNEESRNYLKTTAKREYEEVTTDPDFEYHQVINYKAEDIEPMVALPHRPDNVQPVINIQEQKISIQQVYVGGCTGGKLEDINQFAKTLAGKKIASTLQVIVVPATTSIYRELMSTGVLAKLMDSGVAVESPGCKACYGVQGGVTGDGENCLATINRNFRGRMGNPKSNIYLSSPITAAHSAIAGYITK